MKILDFLACLSWLLLPAFAKFRPFVQMPSQSVDHPDRIMEQSGQLDCLGHNFHDLDILRRHEAALINYPEVRVGCETLSLKPFRPSSQPPSKQEEDPWGWNYENEDKTPPKKATELEDKVVKYFVIDMYGVETAVGPGSEVTVATYDLSQVYASENDESGPVLSDLSKRPETFAFEQLCFPSVCYRPGDTKPEACRNYMEMFRPEDGSTFLVTCADLPSDECSSMIGHTADDRRSSKGKSVGSVYSSNITTYCSLETISRPLLGPLRTPIYSGLPDLISSSSSLRHQVHSDTYMNPDEQDLRKFNLLTSTLVSSHYRTAEYKNETLVTSCLVTVPLEAPFNTTFAVDFFVAENQHAVEKPIGPGQQVALIAHHTEEYKSEKYGGATMFRTHEVPYQVKFEDLCFPVECFQEPPPGDETKCQLVKPRDSRYTPPGAQFSYVDQARSVNKLLWPTEGYYDKFTL